MGYVDRCLPTIPESELIEAYGIVDDYRDEFDALPSPEKETTAQWSERFHAFCRTKLESLGNSDNAPNLIEGYEYQSNGSGTGIVNVVITPDGRIHPSHITIRHKEGNGVKATA